MTSIVCRLSGADSDAAAHAALRLRQAMTSESASEVYGWRKWQPTMASEHQTETLCRKKPPFSCYRKLITNAFNLASSSASLFFLAFVLLVIFYCDSLATTLSSPTQYPSLPLGCTAITSGIPTVPKDNTLTCRRTRSKSMPVPRVTLWIYQSSQSQRMPFSRKRVRSRCSLIPTTSPGSLLAKTCQNSSIKDGSATP